MISYLFVLLHLYEHIRMKIYHVQFVSRVVQLAVPDQMFQQVKISSSIKSIQKIIRLSLSKNILYSRGIF